MIDRQHKLDIAYVRETILRTLEGRKANLETAAALLDRVLMESCPHERRTRIVGWDDARDRMVTTCPPCGISWYAHPEFKARENVPEFTNDASSTGRGCLTGCHARTCANNGAESRGIS